MATTNIRAAIKEDCQFIFEMIVELAVFEKEPDQVKISVSDLKRDGFEITKPLFQAIILELDDQAVGMALFYYRYSTWKGKSLYLEDLYVQPGARGHGMGLMAMKYLAKFAVENGCQRFEWQVLDWNEDAIKFYNKLGADLLPEWINCRLEGEKIKMLS